MHMIRLLFCSILLISACSAAERTPTKAFEVTGSQAERVASVVAGLLPPEALASGVLDAHLLEERIGDGNFGPADYQTFIHLIVAPHDVARWKAELHLRSSSATYAAPAAPPAWWLTEQRFNQLERFDSATLVGHNGWITLDATSGEIFIYFFTT